MDYNFKKIEKKWQDIWYSQNTFAAKDDYTLPKFYCLVEFPYPSGQGLHVGHPRSYTALDIVARKKRLQGYNVLYPMGWDAFGLPTENYAIKNHIHPAEVTKQNIAHFKQQLQSLGFSFDWTREINTTDPEYYKWTQWIFLQLFKKGLAYKKEMAVNWCTSCKCVLANEEVVNGVCERCGSEVIRKKQSQWMLKITDYADRLAKDLDDVDFIDRVKVQQRNWIGKSRGAEVDFKTTLGDVLTVYTTRCDTLFGATYMVISPEHPLIEKWAGSINNLDEVRAYQQEAARKSDFERTELNKDKTGVCLDGVMGINPVNDTEIPIFISDYVLTSYGTGAIMAVPAHDTRDWEFAKKFNLPIIEVVAGGEDVQKEAFTDCATGTLVNSGFISGMSVEEAKHAMIDWLEKEGKGREKINFKLRDWVFSRQRYWGEPIPLIFRPWHEHTGSGFWWGKGNATAQEFVALWQFTISYLSDVKGLHNLIWAYSPDMVHLNSRDAYLEYWPGDEWVDILGLDAYDRNGADYDHKGLQMIRLMKNIAYTKNKPLALTETGLENNNPEESSYYNKKWWTSMLYKIIENEPVSFVLLWRNGDFPTNGGHYFSAFRGCYSEKDFMDFSRKEQILFEDDLPDMYKLLK